MAVASNLGGGTHGYLGATLPPAEYNILPGAQPFVPPVHPGAHPGHPTAATAAQITETNRAYAESKEDFDKYKLVIESIKQQILAAVDHTYLQNLEHNFFGFANVTIVQFMTHLNDTYGEIEPDDLASNLKRLDEPWNPADPIEDLWQRITDITTFADDGGSPISAVTVVTSTLAVIEATGLFGDAVYDWRKRPANQWTLNNFKDDFYRANKERLRKLTTGQAGYHGASNATETTANTVAGTTPTVATPGGGTNTGTGAVIVNDTKMYYCWTHGLGKNKQHTSATCNNKAEGHKDNATINNMQGGNNKIMTGRRNNANANNANETNANETSN